ncbi:MAG TPA: VOC family protein [Longimicrobiales bacterium]|nr:VOC family protein [Longimicrobiales bacterium]
MDRSMDSSGIRFGTVHLRVRDLPAQVAFYEDVFGFYLLAQDGALATLGTYRRQPLLVLHGAPGAPFREAGTTGLFHVAFRLPTRADLGAMILRIHAHRKPIDGFADHHVSEAIYLTDPEGNGLEFYVDRPREVWRSINGGIFMNTEALDVAGLLTEAPGPAPRLPSGTVVGHVHLRVASLAAAEAFYVGRLGLEVTNRAYPGAVFVAAEGYHHHVGLNVWGGEHAPRPEAGSVGLLSFGLVVPAGEERMRILSGADEGTLVDPDLIEVRIAAR